MFSNIITNAAAVLESKGIKCSMYNGCKLDSALQHVALEEPIVFKSEDIPVGCEALYECYTDGSNDPEFYTFSDPTLNAKVKRFITLLIKNGSVDYKGPMIRRFIFVKEPNAKKVKKEKKERINITCKNVGRITWKALLSFCEAMSYAATSIDDDDEDEPILNEIKGPDLAVSTRFG